MNKEPHDRDQGVKPPKRESKTKSLCQEVNEVVCVDTETEDFEEIKANDLCDEDQEAYEAMCDPEDCARKSTLTHQLRTQSRQLEKGPKVKGSEDIRRSMRRHELTPKLCQELVAQRNAHKYRPDGGLKSAERVGWDLYVEYRVW